MQTQSSLDFVEETLPGIIGDHDSLRAVFATYNRVDDYPSGEILTGKPNLSIMVANGEMPRDPIAISLGMAMLGQGMNTEALAIVTEICEDGAQAQRRVKDALAAAPELGGMKMLAVIYAGLTAFEQSVDFAQQLHTQHTNVTTVIVTCDCDLRRKLHDLDARKDVVDHVVVTSLCGGRGDMRTILEGLISAW